MQYFTIPLLFNLNILETDDGRIGNCALPTNIHQRYQAYYTTPCTGIVSYGAKSGGLRVYADHTRTNKRKTNAFLSLFVFTLRPQYMQITHAPDKQRKKDPQIQPHARIKMAQGLVSLVYICGLTSNHARPSWCCLIWGHTRSYCSTSRPPNGHTSWPSDSETPGPSTRLLSLCTSSRGVRPNHECTGAIGHLNRRLVLWSRGRLSSSSCIRSGSGACCSSGAGACWWCCSGRLRWGCWLLRASSWRCVSIATCSSRANVNLQ